MTSSVFVQLTGAAALGLGVRSVATAAPVEVRGFALPLDRVRLLPGPFKDRPDIDARCLLEAIEPDRLVAGFRVQAGLSKKADRYGGWEARGINGEVLAVNQSSSGIRPLFRTDYGKIAWIAEVPGTPDKYLAVFNTAALYRLGAR